MRDTQRERPEVQGEGEAGSMQGARHGTRSWVSRIRPWAEGGAQPLSHWDTQEKYLKSLVLGHLSGSVVERLPSAQVMTPGSWDRVLHRAPCMEPASPSAYISVSLSVSLMNK